MFKRSLLAAAVASASALLFAGHAMAVSIATVEGSPTGTAVTIGDTNTATINYIASKPGTLDGYTYTNYAILTSDGTGSIDLFGHLPTGSTYVPTVGDDVTASGTYSPFDGIPEISTLTAISTSSSGNPVLSPIVTNIPALNAVATTPNYGLSEYLLELDNVYLLNSAGTGAAQGTFPVHANGTYMLYDGTNKITAFQWASSYMAAGALGGTQINTGLEDVTGIVDVFGTGATAVAEFVPFSITPVPEPTSIALLGVAGAALLARRRTAR
jgi:hypothetical protein